MKGLNGTFALPAAPGRIAARDGVLQHTRHCVLAQCKHSPKRERQRRQLGVALMRSVRDMASFGFLVFASGLIVIVFRRRLAAPSLRRETAAAARETTTMATPYPGNVTPLVNRARHRGGPDHPHHQPVRPASGAAARLGRFQGGAEPRHHPLRDLSGARTGAGAHGARLFGAAAAVSAGGGLCPARPVRRPRSL